MARNRLYLLLAVSVSAGYGWLALAYLSKSRDNSFTPCLFKNATGIACPSCGATRSVLFTVHGDLESAFLLNPIGIIIAIGLLTIPFWLLYDAIFKKDSLYIYYKRAEQRIQVKWVAIVLTSLILINWAWNILKGL